MIIDNLAMPVALVYPCETQNVSAQSIATYLSNEERLFFDTLDSRAQCDWFAGRIAAKRVAQMLGDTDYRTVAIHYEPTGRPAFVNHGGTLSISHSYGWGAAIYAPHTWVGIDIEQSRTHDESLLYYILDDAEQLLMRDSAYATDITTLAWTAKESVMKAEGIGLTAPHSLIIETIDTGSGIAKLTVRASPSHFRQLLWNVTVFTLETTFLAVALPIHEHTPIIVDRSHRFVL